MKLVVSTDGKHIAGYQKARSIAQTESPITTEPKPEEPRFVNITTAEPSVLHSVFDSETMANVASQMADDYRAKAKLARDNAMATEYAIRCKKQTVRKLRTRIAHVESAMPTCVKTGAGVGFCLGAIVSASEFIRLYGTPACAWEVILASVVFIIAGAICGWFFAWVLRNHFDDRRATCKSQLRRQEAIIERLTAEKQFQLSSAAKHDEEAKDEHRRSLEYRGFTNRKN